jgi:hypothetical protein
MRTMYDSVNAKAIPSNAEMVAGYVDGRYSWSAQDWARFPNSTKVRISAIGATHLAHVFDVEPGCIWPMENVIPLVRRARDAGIDPTVYINEQNHWAAMRRAFQRAGVLEPHYWVANYNGVAAWPAGSVARQYAHPADPPGSTPSGPWETPGHYDLSAVADYWPGVDPRAPGGGGTEEEMGYAAFQVHLPATPEGENGEFDILLPWRDSDGGENGVQSVTVTLHAPGMPYLNPEDPEQGRHALMVNFGHWVKSDGSIALFCPDNTELEGHEDSGGQNAPALAKKLTLVYSSPVGANVLVETVTAALS